MTERHSPECQERFRQHTLRLAAYETAWPNACRKCDGLGWSEGYDSVPVPFGPGSCLMPSGEPCQCTVNPDPGPDRGVCPRCRQVQSVESDAFIEGQLPCENCGWQWGHQPGDLRPEFECWGECLMVEA